MAASSKLKEGSQVMAPRRGLICIFCEAGPKMTMGTTVPMWRKSSFSSGFTNKSWNLSTDHANEMLP